MFDSYARYPKRHQLDTFDSHLTEIEFRLSLLPRDSELTESARYTTGYTISLWSELSNVRVLLDAPTDFDEPDPWDTRVSITSQLHLRGTLAVAEGLLQHELPRPPPLNDLHAYVSSDPLLAELHQRWSSSHELLLSPPRPLHELLEPFAAAVESYLTIDSIYARVDGPRPPRKRR